MSNSTPEEAATAFLDLAEAFARRDEMPPARIKKVLEIIRPHLAKDKSGDFIKRLTGRASLVPSTFDGSKAESIPLPPRSGEWDITRVDRPGKRPLRVRWEAKHGDLDLRIDKQEPYEKSNSVYFCYINGEKVAEAHGGIALAQMKILDISSSRLRLAQL